MMRKNIIPRLLNVHPEKLACCFHTIVSSCFLACYISMAVTVLIADNKYLTNRFLADGFASMGYLFSMWVLASETICFGMYTAIDILGLYYKQSEKAVKMSKTLRTVASHMLFSVVFPLSVVVLILFWGFYFYDRELIYPAILDELLPPFINHMMHTYPVPLSILYMFTDIKKEPPKYKTLGLLTVFMTIYSLLFIDARKKRGQWIYPALEALTPLGAIWVLTSSLIGSFVFFFLGYYLYGKIKDMRSYIKQKVKELKSL
ncbi:androgen-induced gene 1 protein [Halyomorpha halys]|uniref:androgen-induced gene 1 protein n=1 Tax=Halyomorpha halys TaxID=286706 RepID=UPI0006D52895|nr:androgen-dependent TFPI-regulating protein-like [Halyomorpha halys]